MIIVFDRWIDHGRTSIEHKNEYRTHYAYVPRVNLLHRFKDRS